MYHTAREKDLGQTVHSDAASATTDEDFIWSTKTFTLEQIFFFLPFSIYLSNQKILNRKMQCRTLKSLA